MANRFTATEKWVDPWFCGLNEKDKLFWIYLVDNCDHAGMWQVNWPLVQFHIKDYVFNEKVFNGRVVQLKEGKWFIPKFIEFQYKTGLNPENRAHLSVINILKKEGVYKGLTRGLQARKDMDKDKDKDMVKVKDKDKGVDLGEFEYLKNPDFEKTFNSFLDMRKGNKKPATDHAKRLILAKLQKVDLKTAIAMLEQSIVGSWQDVFPLKNSFQSNPSLDGMDLLKQAKADLGRMAKTEDIVKWLNKLPKNLHGQLRMFLITCYPKDGDRVYGDAEVIYTRTIR